MASIIFIFGDSIAHSSWDPEGGWAGRLNRFLMERVISDEDQYFVTYNLGISGNTSSDILKRFDQEVAPRLREERRYIFIFAVGINDAARPNGGEKRTETEEFEKNLKSLANAARKYSNEIIFIGLTPVIESRTAPLAGSPRKLFYRNADINAYNDRIRDMAASESLLFINVAEALGDSFEAVLDDGLHPNSGGHQRMFERIRDELLKAGII